MIKKCSGKLKPAMDLNQPVEFIPQIPSPQTPQVHNLMPMTSFASPYHQHHHPTKEEKEEAARLSRLMQIQGNSLEMFWNQQMFEINNTSVFRNNHQLPFARIKRIMKATGDVKLISADTPIVFSKACELFILELTLRAWLQTEVGKRRKLQRCDIARALRHDPLLGFLVDVVPMPNYQYKNAKDEKSSEEFELHLANQKHFPAMNTNGDLVGKNREVGVRQQLLMKPSFSSDEFNYASASE